MLAAFRGELFKVARRPAVWVCVVALILLAVAFSYVLLGLVYSHPPKGSNQNLPPGTTLSIFLGRMFHRRTWFRRPSSTCSSMATRAA